MAFGERLKEARLMRGYTQKQLAEKLGIAGTTVTGYEKNNSEPSMLIINRIMKTLDVDANFLFQDEAENVDTLLEPLEYQLIEKYRALDSHGKKMVDFTLENEYQRSISNVIVSESEDEEIDLGASAVIKPYDGPKKDIINRILKEDVEEEFERLNNELTLRGYLGNEDEDKKESKK